MDLQRPNLTRGQRAFAEAFARLGNREAAEQEAGLTPGYGYKLLLRPDVQSEIIAREHARLISEGLPAGLDALIEIARSTKAPAASRVAAGKALLDRALPIMGEARQKDLHELSPDEISKAIANLEGMAASMATPVSAPDPFN